MKDKVKQLPLFIEKPEVVIRCRICNRKLRSEKAKKDGYGHYCYKLYLKGYRGFQSTIDNFIKEKHD